MLGWRPVFPSFNGALLDSPDQFFFLALDEALIVIRQSGPLLLELAFDDVPVAFHH
jgi:hypothetical protein